MARTYIDRRGGHTNSMLDAGDGIMIVSSEGRRFFKRRCVHQMRRESKRIERLAMIEYWDDIQERLDWEHRLEELEACYESSDDEYLDYLREEYRLQQLEIELDRQQEEEDKYYEDLYEIHMPSYYDRYH